MQTPKQNAIRHRDYVDGPCHVHFEPFQPAIPERGVLQRPPMVTLDGSFTSYELHAILDALDKPDEGEPIYPCGACQAWGYPPDIVDGACTVCLRTEATIIEYHGRL